MSINPFDLTLIIYCTLQSHLNCFMSYPLCGKNTFQIPTFLTAYWQKQFSRKQTKQTEKTNNIYLIFFFTGSCSKTKDVIAVTAATAAVLHCPLRWERLLYVQNSVLETQRSAPGPMVPHWIKHEGNIGERRRDAAASPWPRFHAWGVILSVCRCFQSCPFFWFVCISDTRV